MAYISIRQATTAGWASRASIYRAMKSGTLTSHKTPDGQVMLDPAELVRVFGEPRLKSQAGETNLDRERQPATVDETAILKERLDSLERERARLERDVAEARDREVWLRQQLDRQTALLTSQVEAKGSGWLGRLLGRKG